MEGVGLKGEGRNLLDHCSVRHGLGGTVVVSQVFGYCGRDVSFQIFV